MMRRSRAQYHSSDDAETEAEYSDSEDNTPIRCSHEYGDLHRYESSDDGDISNEEGSCAIQNDESQPPRPAIRNHENHNSVTSRNTNVNASNSRHRDSGPYVSFATNRSRAPQSRPHSSDMETALRNQYEKAAATYGECNCRSHRKQHCLPRGRRPPSVGHCDKEEPRPHLYRRFIDSGDWVDDNQANYQEEERGHYLPSSTKSTPTSRKHCRSGSAANARRPPQSVYSELIQSGDLPGSPEEPNSFLSKSRSLYKPRRWDPDVLHQPTPPSRSLLSDYHCEGCCCPVNYRKSSPLRQRQELEPRRNHERTFQRTAAEEARERWRKSAGFSNHASSTPFADTSKGRNWYVERAKEGERYGGRIDPEHSLRRRLEDTYYRYPFEESRHERRSPF